MRPHVLGRRGFLGAAGSLAAVSLLGGRDAQASEQATGSGGAAAHEHMLENVGAAAVRFTPPEITELNAAVSSIAIAGARLPDGVLALSGVEAAAKN